MANATTFKITSVTASEKQAAKGIVSVNLQAGDGADLFVGETSGNNLSITVNMSLADAQAKFAIGSTREGFKAKGLISQPWKNTSGLTIRHRNVLVRTEAEKDQREALVAAEYAKYAAEATPQTVTSPVQNDLVTA